MSSRRLVISSSSQKSGRRLQSALLNAYSPELINFQTEIRDQIND